MSVTVKFMMLLMLSIACNGIDLESPKTQRVIMDLDNSNNVCKGININNGELKIKDCSSKIIVEDLKETMSYSCEELTTYIFYGPLKIHTTTSSCTIMGLPICSSLKSNPYAISKLCPGVHKAEHESKSTALIIILSVLPVILIVSFRWIIIRKIYQIPSGKKLASTKYTEDGRFCSLFTIPRQIARSGNNKINIISIVCGRGIRGVAVEEQGPRSIDVRVDDRLNAMSLTLNKTQFVILLILTLNVRPVITCITPITSNFNIHSVVMQEGYSFCSNEGTLTLIEMFNLFDINEQYNTAPWCMDTDGWQGNTEKCGGEKLCLARGDTGIPNNTIEKSDIAYNNYCSKTHSFKNPLNIRRMHCHYISEMSRDVVWRGGEEWYYANCRDYRLRILFDMNDQYLVSKVSRSYIHVKVKETGNMLCKFHPIYTETNEYDGISLVESVNSNKKYICPLLTNHLRPTSGTLGDFQTKDNKTASVDWMSFQCESSMNHQKCIGSSSFILGGLKGCTRLPGFLGTTYYYFESNQLIGDKKNSLLSGTVVCESEQKIVYDKLGNCTVLHSSLWGVKRGEEQLRLVISLAAAEPGFCYDLKSSCLHHTVCVPCNGEVHTFFLNSNNCKDLRVNYTDNSVDNNDLTATSIDYSLKIDPGTPLSAPGGMSNWLNGALHFGLIGLNSSMLIILFIILIIARSK